VGVRGLPLAVASSQTKWRRTTTASGFLLLLHGVGLVGWASAEQKQASASRQHKFVHQLYTPLFTIFFPSFLRLRFFNIISPYSFTSSQLFFPTIYHALVKPHRLASTASHSVILLGLESRAVAAQKNTRPRLTFVCLLLKRKRKGVTEDESVAISGALAYF